MKRNHLWRDSEVTQNSSLPNQRWHMAQWCWAGDKQQNMLCLKKTTTRCCFLIVFIKEELLRSHGSCCFFPIFPPSSFSYTGCLFLALSLPCLSSLVGSTGAIKLWFLFGNFIILPWFVEASGGNDWTVTSKQCGSFWHSAAKHRSALLLTEPRTKVLIPCLPLAVPPH